MYNEEPSPLFLYPTAGSTASSKSKTVRTKRRQPSESSTLNRHQLSVVDSDEELELVKLVPGGAAGSQEVAGMASGREHPFSPMVNREMLLSLVRDAFRQTEEQQINFEATLKQEYSRRSKGEVSRNTGQIVEVVSTALNREIFIGIVNLFIASLTRVNYFPGY